MNELRMDHTLEHNGYTGTIDYDWDSRMFFGEVVGEFLSPLYYQGRTIDELMENFVDTVDYSIYVQDKV